MQKETLKVQQDILAEIREIRADTNMMRGDIGHLVGDNLERKIGYRLPGMLAHRLELSDLEVALYQERAIIVDPELQEVIAQAYGSGSINQGPAAQASGD